jgi:hypothetical protein
MQNLGAWRTWWVKPNMVQIGNVGYLPWLEAGASLSYHLINRKGPSARGVL